MDRGAMVCLKAFPDTSTEGKGACIEALPLAGRELCWSRPDQAGMLRVQVIKQILALRWPQNAGCFAMLGAQNACVGLLWSAAGSLAL